jgi:hypothetical protein
MDNPSSPPAVAKSPPPALLDAKNALLVIHGIGEQNPYEALDSFARGLFAYLRDQCKLNVRLQAKETAHTDWTEVFVRIEVQPGDANPSGGYIDIHEYYWAPQTEDKISYLQTLQWLVTTALSPLRYFGQNLQEMFGVRDPNAPRGWFRALWLFWREMRRVVFLFVPLAVGSIWLINWLGKVPKLADILAALKSLLEGPQLALAGIPLLHWLPKWIAVPANMAVLALYALGTWMIFLLIRFAVEYFQQESKHKTTQRYADVSWLASTALVAVGSFYLGTCVAWSNGVQLLAALQSFRTSGGLGIVATLLVAAAVKYLLVDYVADVAVYVNSDAKSKNYVARNAILKESTAALASILANPEHDRVILAGHSLGSVIAYDTINELFDRSSSHSASTSDKPDLGITREVLDKKLKGLVTFGSPLDKIYYFFRQQVKSSQPIRAQILSMLHSFRKTPSGRDYGEFKFSYEKIGENIRWLNAWSPLDPVSARLDFYRLEPDDQDWFWYWVPGLAHLGYWSDPKFYKFVGDRLLVHTSEKAQTAGLKAGATKSPPNSSNHEN